MTGAAVGCAVGSGKNELRADSDGDTKYSPPSGVTQSAGGNLMSAERLCGSSCFASLTIPLSD